MARIRTIKPEFFRHGDLYDCEVESGLPVRLAFAGLWCVADREGRFKWRPRDLKVEVLPHDPVDFSRVLDALVTRGFIRRYASNGQDFGYIPSFTVHQVINNRESPSNLPPPNTDNEINDLTREARVEDASVTREARGLRGKEGKGKEGKGKEQELEIPTNSSVAARDDTPEQAWVVMGRAVKDAIAEFWPDDARVLGMHVGLARQWIADGFDLDRDVIPTITRLCADKPDRKPPGSLSYFTEAITRRHRERLAEPPEPSAEENAAAADRLKALYERQYRETGQWKSHWTWQPKWGPRPDMPQRKPNTKPPEAIQ